MADCKMLDIIVVGYAPQQGAKAALLKRNGVNLYETRHNSSTEIACLGTQNSLQRRT
jgi:hypothetical protein